MRSVTGLMKNLYWKCRAFNVENALAAIAIAYVMNIPVAYIHSGLNGPLQRPHGAYHSKDHKVVAIVDYAHNKLSFENYLPPLWKSIKAGGLLRFLAAQGKKRISGAEIWERLPENIPLKVSLVAEDPGMRPWSDISILLPSMSAPRTALMR